MSTLLLLLVPSQDAPGPGLLPGDLTITVGNLAEATDDLVIGTVSLDPDTGDFEIVADFVSGATLAPGEQRVVVVRFTPTTEGDHTTTLRVTSSDPDGTEEIILNGTGLASDDFVPGIEVDPPSWDAGDVEVTDDTAELIVSVTSTGTGDLTVGTVAIAGAAFAKSEDEATGQVIPPGETRTILVTFDPSAEGVATGTLTIPNDAGASVVVDLSGTGIPVPDEEPPPDPPYLVERFYLGRQAAPAGLSVTDSSWNRHTPDADNAMTVVKGGSVPVWGSTVNLTHGQRTRLARWWGPPMADQSVLTVFTAVCTAAYRSSVLGEFVTSAIRFGIWRAATETVEWQGGIMGHSGAVEPWHTVDDPTPRRLPSGPPYSWSVDVELEDGDRLVIEAGARGVKSTTTTGGVRMRWGGSSTSPDVLGTVDVQLSSASWIEFSGGLLVLP